MSPTKFGHAGICKCLQLQNEYMGPSSQEPGPTTYVDMKRAGVWKKSESAMDLTVDGDGEVAVIRSGSLSPESRALRKIAFHSSTITSMLPFAHAVSSAEVQNQSQSATIIDCCD